MQAGDPLDPQQLEAELRRAGLPWAVDYSLQLDSTQSRAALLAQAGAPEFTWVIAEEQTAGRGRHGNRWSSAPGEGIYCTLILRPRCSPVRLLALTLAAGVAVREGLQRDSELALDLRWPNDLLFEGKKVSGILLESSGDTQKLQYALLGIGVNVQQRQFPGDLATPATSLALALGRNMQRRPLLVAIARSFARRYRLFQQERYGELLAEFAAHSSYARGLQVTVGARGGPEQVYCGTTEGLDENGFLLVRTTAGELRTVVSGDVRPVRDTG